MTPRALDRLVKICLAKDPEDRWQTARDVGLQLREIERDREHPETVTVRPVRSKVSRALPWAAALVALGIGAVLGRAALPKTAPPEVVRSTLLPPPNTEFHFLDANSGTPAVSPDGKRIAFSARNAYDQVMLWVRPLDSLDSFMIPGTGDATFPFWSPDGRSLGFFAARKLKIVQASASAPPPVPLADVVEGRGGAWGPDGTILYSPGQQAPIFRVPASGGSATPATSAQEGETHRWPVFLPDGRRFLYTARVRPRNESALYAGSLDTKERREILREDTDAVYSPPGYLLFHRSGRLMAAPFDAERAEMRGEPFELVDGIDYFPPTVKSVFSATENVLTYSPASDARLTRLAWFDRAGREVGNVGTTGMYVSPRLSPDGGRLAVSVIEQLSVAPKIWLFDARLGTGTRSTRAATSPDLNPVFSPDGARIFFSRIQQGVWNVFVTSAGGEDESETLLPPSSPRWPNDVTSDGQFLLYREFSTTTRGDLKILPLSGERKPRDFVATGFDEDQGAFSPDGRRVAYVSDESGRKEVFVATFPDPTERLRISPDGGTQPRWSRDGRELYYVSGGRTIMAAAFDVGMRPAEPPRRLFDVPIHTAFRSFVPFKYDVAPDGRFLIVVRASQEPPPPLVLVLNWQAGLKK
jgi:Tol biopolymer transport system component